MYGCFDLLVGVKMFVCYCLFGCVMLWRFVLVVFYRYNVDCWFVYLVWDCYCLVWFGWVVLGWRDVCDWFIDCGAGYDV